ncbi:MAG: hypothetical protein RLZZ74_3829 [Cyanobacteriota bacterium]|jgi:hypothetical protein
MSLPHCNFNAIFGAQGESRIDFNRLISQHQSSSAIIASGHDPAIVSKVRGLVSRAEFKRRQAPPGIKITDRAFGTGWRMPIAKRWSSN